MHTMVFTGPAAPIEVITEALDRVYDVVEADSQAGRLLTQQVVAIAQTAYEAGHAAGRASA